jgi:ornithine carbamoyltransferase
MALDVAHRLKAIDQNRTPGIQWAYPRTMAIIFEKPSLRTRVSLETSMVHLRGQAIYLAPGDVGLGVREPVEDVAGVLSRWVDVIVARVFAHTTVEDLAKYSSSPVINALSDREHPLQALADLLTLEERKGKLGNDLKLAYVGDGNNVLHALMVAGALTGVHVSAACPEGYAPDPEYVSRAREIGGRTGATFSICTGAAEAVADADAVYTDVWASMGQESEKAERADVFRPYQVSSELLQHAKPDAIVLHCLPAHRGEEITAEVMEAHKTVIFDQAENRMHTLKALLLLILGL